MTTVQERAVVVGTGPAGLAVAATLDAHGIRPLVLERTDTVASSWKGRYESLRLNTPRVIASMPRYPIPRRYGRWLTLAQTIEYLEEYARRHVREISFGTEVQRVDRQHDHWRLQTSRGEICAQHVVIATGHDAEPKLPDWPGHEAFGDKLSHAADYRVPDPYRGRDVLVVAPNTSGSEIAYELVCGGASRVRVAMRTPPFLTKREWPPGVPVNFTGILLDHLPISVADRIAAIGQRLMFGNLSRHGLPPSPIGAQTSAKVLHMGALFDEGFVQALKDRRLELVAAVAGFDGDDVVLVDGSRLRPDAVIAATGYSRALEPIVGHLGVLDARGNPTPIADQTHPDAPGLYFNGFHVSVAGQMFHMRRHARRIARAIARSERGPRRRRNSHLADVPRHWHA